MQQVRLFMRVLKHAFTKRSFLMIVIFPTKPLSHTHLHTHIHTHTNTLITFSKCYQENCPLQLDALVIAKKQSTK